MKPEIFIQFCQQMGLPAPVAELKFHPTRRWRFDYAWPEHRIALEVEGGIWAGGRHTSAKGFLADMEKYNTAAAMGWRVLRITPKSLCTILTTQLIKDAMGSPEKQAEAYWQQVEATGIAYELSAKTLVIRTYLDARKGAA